MARPFPLLIERVHAAPEVCAKTVEIGQFPPFITGLVLSTTVTLNTQVCVLPAASVAVTVTVVVPTENCDPDGGLDTIVGAPLLRQLSVAVTVQVAACEQVLVLPPPLAVAVPLLMVKLAGQRVNVGLSVSLWKIVNVQVFVLPEPSVAVIVTTVLVTDAAMIVPAGGDCVLLTITVQLSVAVAFPVMSGITVVQAIASLYKVVSLGQVICGLTLSCTITVVLQVLVLPDGSVTVSTTVLLVLVFAQLNDDGLMVIVTGPQLSEAVSTTSAGVKVTWPFASSCTVMDPLQVTDGPVWSLSNRFIEAVLVLPFTSVIRKVTTLVPPKPVTGVPIWLGAC